MFGRLIAKAIFVAIAIAMAFFGIGFLGAALAVILVQGLGRAGAFAVVGFVLFVPPLIWALLLRLWPRKKRTANGGGANSQVVRLLLTAIAKETPWAAVAAATLVGVANMFLSRHKAGK